MSKSIQEQFEQLKKDIDLKLKAIDELLTEEDNQNKEDEKNLELNNIDISSNFDTWTDAKKYHSNDLYEGAFYIKLKEPENFSSFTVKEAKQLIEFLQDRITYLEMK